MASEWLVIGLRSDTERLSPAWGVARRRAMPPARRGQAPRGGQPHPPGGAGSDASARVGPSWSARSEHRDHRDRSIVIKKIGIVITGIGASW